MGVFLSVFQEMWTSVSFGFMMGRLGFASVLGFYKGFEICQIAGPESAVLLDPGVDGTKRFGTEFVDPVPAFAVFTDQMGAAQQAQMLGDRGTRYRECFRDLTGGLAAEAQEIQNGAAGWIRKGLESRFRGICN
jgi:hypothetical protein